MAADAMRTRAVIVWKHLVHPIVAGLLLENMSSRPDLTTTMLSFLNSGDDDDFYHRWHLLLNLLPQTHLCPS